jgi:hypothetical protein
MNRINLAQPKNNISISKNGLNATNKKNASRYETVSAKKGFGFSVDFPDNPILHYFEVTDMSSSDDDEWGLPAKLLS